jgi:hypothetical protein
MDKLSSADRALLHQLVEKATTDAAPQIVIFLKLIHERERKRRAAGGNEGPFSLPEMKDDEIPAAALFFYDLFDFKQAVSETAIRNLSEHKRERDRFSEIAKTSLFGALDHFLKAGPTS